MHSPLSLLQEEEQARHVLLLSFNVNLGFFERFALSAARVRGARVTVVGDARYVTVDPAGVRNAGISYLDGRALCHNGAAFHPKLVLVVGEDSIAAAIGSGNVTLNGWHGNAEIWSVLRGDDTACPRTLHELGRWLSHLHERVQLSDGVAEVLAEVGRECGRHDVTEEGPLLVSTLDRPIIEQIPVRGPVDELMVYAPFLDDRAAAVSRLMDTMTPASTKLLIQSDKTVFDGQALADLVQRRGVQIEEIADPRYYHGKVVQWREGERTSALVGSANASIAALGHSMASHGNCELGLVTEIAHDLTPLTGEPVDIERLRTLRPRAATEAPSLVLLGASFSSGGISLLVSYPLKVPAWLEVAYQGEAWVRVAEIAPGDSRYSLDVHPLLPAALRLATSDGQVSNVITVTDLERVKRRSIPVSGLKARTNPDDVFTDPRDAINFQHDLGMLREFLYFDKVSPATQEKPQPAVARLKFRNVRDYLDGVTAHLGEEMVLFGLGLPDLRRLLPSEGEEESAERDVAVDTVSLVPSMKRSSKYQRDRYRRWCRDLVLLAPYLPPLARLIAWRLFLRAVVAGLWDNDEWLSLLGDMTSALAQPVEGFAEDEEPVSCALAVSLAVLRSQVRDVHVMDERTILFNRTAGACEGRLDHLSEERIEEYVRELLPTFGAQVHLDNVMSIVSVVRRADPLEDAVDALREAGRDVDREGSLIVVHDLRGDPEMDLLRAVGLAEEAGPVGATGVKGDQRFLVAWQDPFVLCIKRRGSTVIGDIYRCGITTPNAIARAGTRVSESLAKQDSWFGRQSPPASARSIVEALGLDIHSWLE